MEEFFNCEYNNTQDITKIQIIEKRISVWKEKLIDLSKRNRLLNFKPLTSSTLQIINENPIEIYKLLVDDLKTLEFLPFIINGNTINIKGNEHTEKLNSIDNLNLDYNPKTIKQPHSLKLQTKLSDIDLDKKLTKIISNSKSINGDLGYNVLFLSLSSIIWYDNSYSSTKMKSPLLLVPIQIQKINKNNKFTVQFYEDQIILNPVFSLKFKKDFGLNLDELYGEVGMLSRFSFFFSKIK